MPLTEICTTDSLEDMMPRAKYQSIYQDLKAKIEDSTYESGELLPSENVLITQYDCSRNTVRRAIASLAEDGYVQSMHGIGVRVIYQPSAQTSFIMGGIESFSESAERNNRKPGTRVLQLTTLTVDARMSKRTGFPEGEEVWFLQRVRYLDDRPLILDLNMFLTRLVPGLTPEIAEHSVYDYIENVLGMTIVTAKRSYTVERITELDEKWLDLGSYNCMAVITGQVYNADGIMFEYTQSRHRPDYFSFHDTAFRKKR